MRRQTIERWTGACLLSSSLAVGCCQCHCSVSHSPPWTTHVISGPALDQTAPTQPTPALTQAQLSKKDSVPATLPPGALEVGNSVKDAPVTQTGFENSKPNPADEAGAARTTVVDTTALPCFSHSADYTELTGQIQHSRITRGWRLRYAPVDEVDPYGGSVTLIEDAKLSGLKDGDMVRVHGRFLNSDESGTAPRYEVDAIQLTRINKAAILQQWLGRVLGSSRTRRVQRGPAHTPRAFSRYLIASSA